MDFKLTAQMISISGAFFLGSYNITFSQNVIPHLYNQSAAVATPIFDKIFHRGASTIGPIAAIVIAANGYLAYQSDPTNRRLYGAAGALVFASLPLTAIVMKPGINRLIKIGNDGALQAKSGIKVEVASLLKTWVSQNYFRGSLHLTAGFLGLFAALS